MTEKNEPQDLGQQLDELNNQARENAASIEHPEGVESIGVMAEWGNQGLPRWFKYPDEPQQAYQLFKTNAEADPSSTWVFNKYKRRWHPDLEANLWTYRVKGDWYQEIDEAEARRLFKDAFEPHDRVGKKWRFVVEGEDVEDD